MRPVTREELLDYETYGDRRDELLGAPGELGCTLLVEIDDVGDRAVKLAAWTDLPRHLYVRLEDGSRAYARYDQRQVDPHKLSSVQYLKFPAEGRTPEALGTDFPPLAIEVALTDEQRRALAEDLQD